MSTVTERNETPFCKPMKSLRQSSYID